MDLHENEGGKPKADNNTGRNKPKLHSRNAHTTYKSADFQKAYLEVRSDGVCTANMQLSHSVSIGRTTRLAIIFER